MYIQPYFNRFLKNIDMTLNCRRPNRKNSATKPFTCKILIIINPAVSFQNGLGMRKLVSKLFNERNNKIRNVKNKDTQELLITQHLPQQPRLEMDNINT